MKIGVDIDDTLNIVERYRRAKAYIERNNLPFHVKDADSNMFVNVFDWGMSDVVRFIKDGGVSAFTEAEARKGARETLERLSAEGHKIIIVTSRPKKLFSNPERLSRDWLEKRRIPYDEIAVEIEDKGLYCAQNGISVLIDDNPDYCFTAQERGVTAVLAVGKHNLSKVGEIAYAGANWEQIGRTIDRISAVRNAEELFSRMFGAHRREAYDGWELCFDDAPAFNMVVPVDGSTVPMSEKVAHVEERYMSEGKPCRFRLVASEKKLLQILRERGYVNEKKVQCLSVSDLDEETEEVGLTVQTIANRIFVSLTDAGTTVASGAGVLFGERLALENLWLNPSARNASYGTRVVKRIFMEGKKLGAKSAFAQTDVTETVISESLRDAGFERTYDAYVFVRQGV